MDDTKQATIKLVVKDEDDLYSPFSPDDELSDAVKQYIKTKAAGIEYNRIIDLTVISRDHLDEEKFRRAVKSWIRDEKAVHSQHLYRKEEYIASVFPAANNRLPFIKQSCT